jgi:riboflavin transporter FmnP
VTRRRCAKAAEWERLRYNREGERGRIGLKQRFEPRQYAAIVILALMAMVLSYIEFPPFPSVHWLQYDPSGVVSVLATLLYGPVVGVVVSVASWIPHLITNPVGSALNIASTVVLLLVVYGVYRAPRTVACGFGAVAAATAATTALLVLLNFAITPLYASMTYESMLDLLPVLVAFNAGKGLVNSAVALLSHRKLAELLDEPEADEPEAAASAKGVAGGSAKGAANGSGSAKGSGKGSAGSPARSDGGAPSRD